MLKLYKSNYTPDELLAMAEHCQSFCPAMSNDRLGEGCIYCDYYRIAVIFDGLENTAWRKLIKGNTAIVKYLT